MPRDFQRSRRLEEQIQRLLSELIRREVKDPRVGLITITAVEVSADLSHAKVYFLPFDSKREVEPVLRALRSAAGFLRQHLKKALAIRHVPELHFSVDESIERGSRISALINAAISEDVARSAARGDDPTAADTGPEEPLPGKP